MLANIGNYVPSSVEGLQEKLDAAKKVLSNATSQAEIDEATKSLREARLNARTKADVSALEELIAYVNSLDLRAYTAESADSVLVLADRALAKMNDPQITQEEVDALAEELQSAIDALQPVSEENVTTPDDGMASGSDEHCGSEHERHDDRPDGSCRRSGNRGISQKAKLNQDERRVTARLLSMYRLW